MKPEAHPSSRALYYDFRQIMAATSKGVPSKKALSKLGLTTEMLIDAFLGQNAREELSYDECLVFWDGFGSAGTNSRERAVQLYARELLKTLMEALEEAKPRSFFHSSWLTHFSFS